MNINSVANSYWAFHAGSAPLLQNVSAKNPNGGFEINGDETHPLNELKKRGLMKSGDFVNIQRSSYFGLVPRHL